MKLHYFLATMAFMAAVTPTSAIAQAGSDPLARYAAKTQLDDSDRAKIRVEATDRARDLKNAATEDGRRSARAALIGSMKLNKASPAFLKYYVVQCVNQLSPLLSGQQLVPALDAIVVLRQLNHLDSRSAVITGLGSVHVGVRYVAAKASQDLLNLMKGPNDCPGLIAALGKAGRRERDSRVIREIYVSIGIHAGTRNAGLANECAEALADVLESRAQGAGDESVDRLGYKAAADCYKASGASQRNRLRRSARRLMESEVDGFLNRDSSTAKRDVLIGVLSEADNALRKMLAESGVDAPPRQRITSKTTEQNLRDYLKSLDEALAKV